MSEQITDGQTISWTDGTEVIPMCHTKYADNTPGAINEGD